MPNQMQIAGASGKPKLGTTGLGVGHNSIYGNGSTGTLPTTGLGVGYNTIYGNGTGDAHPAAAAAMTAQPAATAGGGGGGGGGAAKAAAPATVAVPQPEKDIDWFNSDAQYRGDAQSALSALTAALANIQANRDTQYMNLDDARNQLNQQQGLDLTANGNDFAGRGLLSSGLYAAATDQLNQGYSRDNGQLDQQAAQIAQQYGDRNAHPSLANVNGQNGLANLASIYGQLGSQGITAGNSYNDAILKARGASADRSSGPLTQTVNWG